MKLKRYNKFISEGIDTDYKYVSDSITNLKFYKNIDNNVDGEMVPYYNVPFKLGECETCITGYSENAPEDKYVLCLNNFYVYDYITDDMILSELRNDLSNIDVSKDWNNYTSGYETAYTNKDRHIKRVAKLVSELMNNRPLNPVSMYFDEQSYIHDIYNYIEDGNHRIRALQYLKYDGYPAYIYGGHSKFLIKFISNNEKI